MHNPLTPERRRQYLAAIWDVCMMCLMILATGTLTFVALGLIVAVFRFTLRF